MRKKIALGGAIHSPRVLFLDEPLKGIDPVSGRVVTDLLRRLASKGVTLFFTPLLASRRRRSVTTRPDTGSMPFRGSSRKSTRGCE